MKDMLQDFEKTVKVFGDITYDRFGSYSYEAGYLESMSKQMFARLPKKAQKEFLQQLQRDLDAQPVKVKNCLTGQECVITYGDRGTCLEIGRAHV